MDQVKVKHPAKFSRAIVEAIERTLVAYVPPGTLAGEPTVLDPFAGVGTIHRLRKIGYQTVGVELEREWADQHPGTICGDSTRLAELVYPFSAFDAVVTSPAYGNRMADAYDGRDGSRRSTYRLALGRPLSDGNGAGLHWGDEYRELHWIVWQQCAQVLKPGGFFLLNVSDFVKNDYTQPVALWHAATLSRLGFQLVRWEPIDTQRFGLGSDASRGQRAREEWLLTFQLDPI